MFKISARLNRLIIFGFCFIAMYCECQAASKNAPYAWCNAATFACSTKGEPYEGPAPADWNIAVAITCNHAAAATRAGAFTGVCPCDGSYCSRLTACDILNTGVGPGTVGAQWASIGQIRIAGVNLSVDATSWSSNYDGPACGCPDSSRINSQGQCECPAEQVWVSEVGKCAPYADRYHEPKMCPRLGNPIYPLTGLKRQTESLGLWGPGFTLEVTYDNRRKVPSNDATLMFGLLPNPSFGDLWESNLHKKLIFQRTTGGTIMTIEASRGAGQWISFVRHVSGSYVPNADIADRVIYVNSEWRYTDAVARTQEVYDASGNLLRVQIASGLVLSYRYSDSNTSASVAPVAGLLISVQDSFGRSVQFQYEQPAGVARPRIKQVMGPDGYVTLVSYDASGNLQKVTWPNAYARQYLYENATLPWALTGILDETPVRYATYDYDMQGRAIGTQHAGGVEHYSVTYKNPPEWHIAETYDSAANVIWRDHYWVVPEGITVTTPNDQVTTLAASGILGVPRHTGQSQPAGSGCAASSSQQSYDANGNVASADDFNGRRTCYGNDLNRNLELVRVDGLANTQVCTGVTSTNATLPVGARKISTQWHPDWRLETKIAEPKKSTTYVYNGQLDPTAGNVKASCAPTNALLPDGKPIVVLCKKIEQATTDVNGSKGFAAATTGSSRVWQYTYNQYGQVLTAIDPGGNTTRHVYYPVTAAEYTMGDLQSTTNAAGHVTQYTRYDRSGRLEQMIAPDGVVTDMSYYPRGWLKQVTTTPPGAASGRSTGYLYDNVGQLKVVTFPDQSSLTYNYDDAHRLYNIQDNLGNSVTYTLDAMGNRKKEEFKDSSGVLVKNISRVYDALNRLQSVTGAQQ